MTRRLKIRRTSIYTPILPNYRRHTIGGFMVLNVWFGMHCAQHGIARSAMSRIYPVIRAKRTLPVYPQFTDLLHSSMQEWIQHKVYGTYYGEGIHYSYPCSSLRQRDCPLTMNVESSI